MASVLVSQKSWTKNCTSVCIEVGLGQVKAVSMSLWSWAYSVEKVSVWVW